MEPGIFHPFPRLPKELRDLIWSLAIRPDRPGAHIFTVFDSSIDSEWEELSPHAMRHPLVRRCSLAAPRSRTSTPQQTPSQFSWVEGNRSAYTIDSGLWTACWESRNAAEQRFRTVEWDKKRKEMWSPLHYSEYPNAPGVGSFRTSYGTQQNCLTYPKSDLFHLQIFKSTVDWYHLYRSIPIFNLYKILHINHISLDFDPNWLGTESDSIDLYGAWADNTTLGCTIRAATDELLWAENLWLVDYRIRRRPSAQPTTANRYEFHGSGCKFTEVREGDAEWELCRTKDTTRFLDQMRESAEEAVRCWNGCEFQTPNIGILAYEE